MYIITGGGSGIGRALALALAARGQSVLIIGRREKPLQDTASTSSLIHYLCADVSTLEGMECIKDHVKFNITGLIHNAGTIEPIMPLKDIPIETWHHAFNVNLNAVLFLTQKLYSKLHQGRVLNIGSAAAYFPVKGWGIYCTTKAALAMLTRCWQLESDSIAFASVMPGIIDTDMQRIIRNSDNMDPKQLDFYKRIHDHHRLISTETVAAFLTWLLLDVKDEEYVAQEWDIYDTSHHPFWLKPPNQVLHWDF